MIKPTSIHAKTIVMLTAGSVLSLILLYMRIHQSSTTYYKFFTWNLLLAWVPLILSLLLLELDRRNVPVWISSIVLFLWLLFFPNSPYMLTDLFHLRPKHHIPVWYDLGMILSFAWNGLMLGFVSLLGVQQFLRKRVSAWATWMAVTIIFLLAGFGIYLGRYERWNSWDLLTNPIFLLKDITGQVMHPLAYPRTVGVTLLFTAFLLISYLTLYFMVDHHKEKEVKG